MATSTEILSLAASVVSAVGGAFAAWAAYRSAQSAHVSQQAADRAEVRAALLEVASSAGSVVVEEQRIQTRSVELKLAYRSLFTMSGASTSSRLGLYITEVDKKLEVASALAADAALFIGGAQSLAHAPADEIDRVQLRLAHSLATVQGMRNDLEREHSSIEAQCAERRESMDRARPAR